MKQLLTQADFTVMPWRNGLGSTTELFRADENGQLKWRISRASVTQDGDFSIFAGIARNLTVISGAGFRLLGDGVDLAARPLRPIAFSGDTALHAQDVQGASDDFNVMTLQSLPRPEVAVISGRAKVAQADMVAIYALDETLVDGDALQMGELMLADQPVQLDGHAIAVRLFG
jgi:uncharacterized protein